MAPTARRLKVEAMESSSTKTDGFAKPMPRKKKRKIVKAKKSELPYLDKLPVVESYPDGKLNDQELTSCGLEHHDYKLAKMDLLQGPKVAWVLTPEVMLKRYIWPLLMNEEMSEYEPLAQLPISRGTLPNALIKTPQRACPAVLQGLGFYAGSVLPKCSVALFGETKEEGITYSEYNPNGWFALTEMSLRLPFFRDLKTQSKKIFAKELEELMEATGHMATYDVTNTTTVTIGSCFGFWLASIYNNQGFEDDQLPYQLSRAKQHFIEYYGFQFGEVGILLDWNIPNI